MAYIVKKVIKIEELVIKAKVGNKEAFSNLILSVKEDLYRIACSKLSDEEDIQDALQNTIINAFMDIRNLKKVQFFKTWISRILINECNAIYKHNKKENDIIDKYSNQLELKTYDPEIMEFDSIIQILNENEQKVFELFYKEDLSIKQISKLLHIKENTIKYILSNGRKKLRNALKPASFIVLVLCVFITTTVIAVSVISYLQNAFTTKKMGLNNDGILMAVENKDWYQKVNMNYIDLGNRNKIKVDYILMDEMCLYIIFDFESEEDISKYNDIIFPDLKITDDTGNIICNLRNPMSCNFHTTYGDKKVRLSKQHIEELYFIYTEKMPRSKTLNISFSKVRLSGKSDKEIETEVAFQIDLDDKFVNRTFVTYASDSPEIERAIISSTGFYALISVNHSEYDPIVKLMDSFENIYSYSVVGLNYPMESPQDKFIIIANLDYSEINKLKLVINDKEYLLNKEEV